MLVGENEEGHSSQKLFSEQLHQVLLDFLDTHLISRVDNIDERVSLVVVIAPVGSDLTLTTDVPNVQLKSVLRLFKIQDNLLIKVNGSDA